MNYQLNFAQLVSYDAGQPGITIEITLSLSRESISVNAKIDTGATDCVFARRPGEQLGLHLEDGERVIISTATLPSASTHREKAVANGE